MTKIKKTLKEQNDIITNLITKLDIANLGNWNTEKVEINTLLNYLKDKTQPKPAALTDDIQMDLSEIENLETTLQTLTDENTRLTNENATLTTKTREQDSIIKNTYIPDLLLKLDQYASKVSDGELKTTLTEITTQLTNLKKEQDEIKGNIGDVKTPTNYWSIGAVAGICGLFFIKFCEIFKKQKKEYENNYE